MKKRLKNNGFTLIELLAVIIILTIIALITIPIIGGILEQSKVEAYKDSVLGAFEAVEYYVLQNNLDDIPTEGIEVTSLNLKSNEFVSGRIIKNSDGQLVAEDVSNGEYCANGLMDELSINKGACDKEVPQIGVSVNGKTATITLKDDQGVVGYTVVKKENEISGWTSIEEALEATVEWVAEEEGIYIAYVKDKNGKTAEKEFTIEESAFCTYAVGDLVQTYNEKENAVEFVIPCSGVYNLDAYGAQGSNYGEYTGGLGGEATGNFYFEKGDIITISVGGQDGTNGGGYTMVTSEAGETLLVAGGGGGAYPAGNGGSGGVEAGAEDAGLLDAGSVGETGVIGGGGGYLGGKAGTVTEGATATTMVAMSGVTLYIQYSYVSAYVHPYCTVNDGSTYLINGATYYKWVEANGVEVYSTSATNCFSPDNNAVSVSGSYLAMREVRTCGASTCYASHTGYHHVMGSLCNATLPLYRKTETKEPDTYTTSYGGSNYIATSLAKPDTTSSLSGVKSGDGELKITLVSFK